MVLRVADNFWLTKTKVSHKLPLQKQGFEQHRPYKNKDFKKLSLQK